MNSKSQTITVRMSNEVVDYVNANSGESRSRFVETAIKGFMEIDMICQWNGIEPRECCEQIGDLFRTGQISFEDGKLVVHENK